MNNIIFSSQKDDWETPNDLFNILNAKYNFTVDVASNDQNYKCKKHYTSKEDGLKQNWDGERVWCNPPYGREIYKWIEKAHNSKCLSVFLIPARTDTKWFHNFIYNRKNVKIAFLQGRIKFKGAINSAPFPSMIVVFNEKK